MLIYVCLRLPGLDPRIGLNNVDTIIFHRIEKTGRKQRSLEANKPGSLRFSSPLALLIRGGHLLLGRIAVNSFYNAFTFHLMVQRRLNRPLPHAPSAHRLFDTSQAGKCSTWTPGIAP